MPETAEAPAQNDEKTQAQSVEFPEAPEGEATGSGGQLDILLDMDVPVTVALGTTQVPVRRLLQLGPGAVLKLEKPIEAPVELYLKDSKFAEAEVVVVDNRFAVRIKKITGAGVSAGASEG
jgi:flagellar motor switch protein FliN